MQRLIDSMSSGLAEPLICVVLYAVRPLILFPASLLTVAAGFVFGPALGVVFTILGSNISASVAYLAGRYFGGSLPGSERTSDVLQHYTERLHENSFESVLLMRLIYVPFDAANYAAGFLHVHWRPFILATILDSLLGTVSLVLFGASIRGNFTDGTPNLNPWTLAASVLIAAGSLILFRQLKRLNKTPRSASRRRVWP